MFRVVPVLLAANVLLTGCERIASDPATRLADQIRDEARKLRDSGAPTRTFTHTPATWPDGIEGDYPMEIRSTPLELRDGKALLTALQ